MSARCHQNANNRIRPAIGKVLLNGAPIGSSLFNGKGDEDFER